MPRKKENTDAQKIIVEETPREYTLQVKDGNLTKLVTKRVEELPHLIEEFRETGLKIKYDKYGNETNVTNPYLVGTYFFKPINPATNVEPIYTSAQLTRVYNLYCQIIEEINLKIMTFQPTLSHFAKFAGMSLKALTDLRFSPETNMKILIERIYSDTFDANLMLSQHKKLDNVSTTYRLKVENEAIEKKAPEVKVNVTTRPVDLEAIQGRLKALNLKTSTNTTYEDDYE